MHESMLSHHSWVFLSLSSLLAPILVHSSLPHRFQDARVAAFKLVFLTASSHPNEDMVARTFPLRVMVKG
jgi:hypothetical protein